MLAHRRPAALDLLAGVLLVAGVVLVLTGRLPAADGRATLDRAVPLLVFLAGVARSRSICAIPRAASCWPRPRCST